MRQTLRAEDREDAVVRGQGSVFLKTTTRFAEVHIEKGQSIV
jgi:hypothetical protein